jgi:hypothetical protein
MSTILQFLLTPDTGPRYLPVLLAAFAYMPPGGRSRSLEQLEMEGNLAEALQIVTVPSDNPSERVYAGGTLTLTLTPAQVELLRARMLENPHWNPLMAGVVVETYRWLWLAALPQPEGAPV